MYLDYTYILIIFFQGFRDLPIPFIVTKVNDFKFGCTNINFISYLHNVYILSVLNYFEYFFLNFMTHTKLILYFFFVFLLTFLFLFIFLLSSLTTIIYFLYIFSISYTSFAIFIPTLLT